MTDNNAKRWCFTINNPISNPDEEDNDRFWDDSPGSSSCEPFDEEMEYLIIQEERGENGTLHWQGFVILKQKHRLSWLKNHFTRRAHWEVARGTNEEARDYCRKEETYTGGFRLEMGKLPERAKANKSSERLERAAAELDIIKEGYKRPREVPSMTLLQCGFIPAYKEITADILGPYRPNLKIITLIGPPGTGKSYAIYHFWPEAGRCIYGNNGTWFQNPTASCMVFEEFHGQIPITKMLQLLDVFPTSLEVKGGMRPAMYTTVVITSNSAPNYWYKPDPDDPKRMDTIHALWDRIGFTDGSYALARETGHFFMAPEFIPEMGMNHRQYINDCRKFFWDNISKVERQDPIEEDTEEDVARLDALEERLYERLDRDSQEERRQIGY